MRILGVDTATWAGSVALVMDGSVRGIVGVHADASHAARLMSSIDFLLQNLGMRHMELDGCAVSVGPGSFTGLRIGIGTVKGLCFALEKPGVGISTLKAMAHSLPIGNVLCPLIDAGRGEIYGCCYKREKDQLIEICQETVEDPIVFLRTIDADKPYIFGTGAEKYKHEIEKEYPAGTIIADFNHFIASSVAVLGSEGIRQGKISNLRPHYIRRSDAELQAEGRGRHK